MDNTIKIGKTLYIQKDGPFAELITLHQTVCTGLVPIYSKDFKIMEYKAKQQSGVSWESATGKNVFQHYNEMLFAAQHNTTLKQITDSLNCLVANIAYERIKNRNINSQIIEVLRHVRNASSHGNRFNFYKNEPCKTVEWRNIKIDEKEKGSRNPLHGTKCFGNLIYTGDLFCLLIEIEKDLPDSYFKSKNR